MTNRAPLLTPLGDQRVFKMRRLDLTVTATDPEGDTVTLTAAGLPAGATWVDQGHGMGVVTWQPRPQQAGDYPVTFTASDGELSTSQTLHITVVHDERGVQGADVRH